MRRRNRCERDGDAVRKAVQNCGRRDRARLRARKCGEIIEHQYPREHIAHGKSRAQNKTVRIKRERSPRSAHCCKVGHTALETFGGPAGKSFEARVQGKERTKRDHKRNITAYIPIPHPKSSPYFMYTVCVINARCRRLCVEK